MLPDTGSMKLFGPRKTDFRWAWIASRVLDPVFLIPFLLVAAVMLALANGLRWRFMALLLTVDALFPAIFFIRGLQTKRFSDWDITDRLQRNSLIFFTLSCHLFGVVLAFFLGKVILFEILLVFWLLAVIFALINLVWKISIHAGVNGALVAFFNHYYGWDRYWWLVIVLAIVLASRVVIKKHTWGQVLVGAGLGLAWITLGLRLWGA